MTREKKTMKRFWKIVVWFVFISSLLSLWLGAADFWHTDLVPRWVDATVSLAFLLASSGEITYQARKEGFEQ